ncbi:MAG: IgGFc-binding protein, partial [Paludibacteraceae bacterium]|nr:IgGFc-binding protein [Paludibacteraceae bacterium]
MKHNNRIFRLLLAALLLTTGGAMHHLSAQTTEGTDFWVTLMRGDERNYDTLSLRFSAKEATKVYIENAYTGYRDTVEVGNNDIRSLKLNNQDYSCYVTDLEGEQVSEKALHVTADKNISMIAANYKDKSFDVASILPTAALMSEYRIQSYPPYAHKNNSQGSHFVIIAAEDNTVVDITPTANTDKGHMAGQTFATDTLMRGQTYYVWTGYGSGDYYDFTGTVIKARGGKKIAVFNGNPHTNIPSIEDRDHVYSQAMPVNYWGKRFAITSSLTTIDNQKDKDNKDYKKLDGFWERIDKIRVQALIDGTVVYVDGDSVYTFDFATNPKHVYEFDFGARDKMTKDGTSFSSYRYFEGASHYVETSCPSAVHLFMTSNRFDHTTRKIDGTDYKYCNGDPSEIWVNPIEQQIKSLTFCTFQTKQVTDHFLNIVTATTSVSSMLLDGKDISAQFQPLNGNAAYSYARITALADGTHTLVSDSGFIAHVYGFGQRESYGYPAGGNTKDLTASMEIDGEIYTPGTKKQICPKGDDNTINLSCKLNYEYESMTWEFGDGSPQQKGKIEEVDHLYPSPGVYEAWVAIQRSLTDWCEGMEQPVDTINFIVN